MAPWWDSYSTLKNRQIDFDVINTKFCYLGFVLYFGSIMFVSTVNIMNSNLQRGLGTKCNKKITNARKGWWIIQIGCIKAKRKQGKSAKISSLQDQVSAQNWLGIFSDNCCQKKSLNCHYKRTLGSHPKLTLSKDRCIVSSVYWF